MLFIMIKEIFFFFFFFYLKQNMLNVRSEILKLIKDGQCLKAEVI